MERELFEQLVHEGIAAIPKKFLDKLSNVAIVVEDEPTQEQLKKNHVKRGWTLFGLYEGIPQTQRGSSYGWVLPDKITIFRKPIEEAAHSPEEIKEIVKDTVWHEVAHHFGMNEGEVRAREESRKRKTGM
jgi:predicted Zn-dependent protease with MMP-like domain